MPGHHWVIEVREMVDVGLEKAKKKQQQKTNEFGNKNYMRLKMVSQF